MILCNYKRDNYYKMNIENPNYETLYFKTQKHLIEANVLNEKITFENKYLRAKNAILSSSHNKGEKDEVLLLVHLMYLNETGSYDSLVKIFGDEANQGIHILCMDTNNPIENVDELKKAKGAFKSDTIIEMNKTNTRYFISIKSKNGANPSILNHTPRSAKVFRSDGILHQYLNSLDELIKEYIEKRTNKLIGEDAFIHSFDTMNNSTIKNDFMSVISYFVFNGTGKGNSNCPANTIMYYNDNNNEEIEIVKCCSEDDKKNYINSIFDNLIISLRDKAMPTKLNETCIPWVYLDHKENGITKQKGSLHIRLS